MVQGELIQSALSGHIMTIYWNQVILSDKATSTRATIIPSAGAILNAFSILHQGKTLQAQDVQRAIDEIKQGAAAEKTLIGINLDREKSR